MNRILKIIILFLLAIILVSVIVFCYFFVGKAHVSDGVIWGVDFSQSQAEYLKLDWKKLYSSIIDDLGAKNIKLHTNWDWVEGKKDQFYFKDIDWQIQQAEQKNVKIIYVLGWKTGRWPECHAPVWVSSLVKEDQQKAVLDYITKVIERYKDSKSIINWQVENEPLFAFGECPLWYYDQGDFLKKEVDLVKSLDPSRKIIISDSGEQSSWLKAAKIGDIVGITMYRNAWTHVTDTFGFESYSFLNPVTYARKAQIVKSLFKKDVICIELQSEPWSSAPLMEAPIEEQLKSMNVNLFDENIKFAKDTGLDKFYLWGVEWWYWMKTQHNHPEIWSEAQKIFK